MDHRAEAAVKRAVENRMRSLDAAERGLDAVGLLSHFSSGADFRILSDGRPLGFDGMADAVQGAFPGLRSIEGGFRDLRVTVLSPGAALVSGRFEERVTTSTGERHEQFGAVTWLWRKIGGEWLIAHGHVDHYPGLIGEEK